MPAWSAYGILATSARATRMPARLPQVLGHSKTCFVLLGSYLFLGENITLRQLGGMTLAISGMVGYGIASSKCAPLASPHIQRHLTNSPCPYG